MLAFRPKVRGLRHVPSKGPVIIASNHLSFSDSIFMPLVVPRKVTFLAKSEYFTSPGPKVLLKKITFIALGQVPVDRSGGRRSEAALITGLKVLADGDCIGIYPEGTRSPDGRLYKGRTGIARLAIESGAPVVLNRLTFFSQCKVPKICPFARLRVALHFFHTHTTATTTNRLDSTRSAGALCCSICSLPSAAARYRRFVRRRFEPIHHLLSLLPMESNCQLLVVLCV